MTDRNANRPGYKKTKVGWIPEEWEVIHLDDISKINKNNLSSSTPNDYSFTYINLGDVNSGSIEISSDQITYADAPSRARRIIHKGDILLSTVRPYLKGFAYIDFLPNDVICSTGFAVITPNNSIDGYFLYQYTFSEQAERYFNACVVGSNYPALNNSDIENMRIPLPPYTEQKKIAEILSTWDRAIEQTRQLIDAKQRLKKGLMQQLLTGRMRFPDFGAPTEKAGELPEGWEEKRLHHLVKLNYGKSPKDILDDKGNIPVVGTSEEIRKGNKSLTKLDTIIIGRKGSIDNVSYFNKPVWTIDTAFYTTDYDGIQPRFLFYLLDFTHLEKYNESTGVPSLSISVLNKIQLRIPHVIEQQRIVDLISIIDKEIVDFTKYISLLLLLKGELMNKLLSGEERV
jgi:type I restriction enzyme S subunit